MNIVSADEVDHACMWIQQPCWLSFDKFIAVAK